MELKADETGYAASHASTRVVLELRRRGILARPLGNVVYMMASQMTEIDTYSELLKSLEDVLGSLKGMMRQGDAAPKACVI